MISVALAVEKLKASGNSNKLLVTYTITSRRHIAMGSSTLTNSSFINGEILSKLALAFSKVLVLSDGGQVAHSNLNCLNFPLLCGKYMKSHFTIYHLINPIGHTMS